MFDVFGKCSVHNSKCDPLNVSPSPPWSWPTTTQRYLGDWLFLCFMFCTDGYSPQVTNSRADSRETPHLFVLYFLQLLFPRSENNWSGSVNQSVFSAWSTNIYFTRLPPSHCTLLLSLLSDLLQTLNSSLKTFQPLTLVLAEHVEQRPRPGWIESKNWDYIL